MNLRLLVLLFVLLFSTPAWANLDAAPIILPQLCWEADNCPGTFQGAFPLQGQSFFAYLESDQTAPPACGTFWHIRYDNSLVEFRSADTILPSGVGNLTFEINPATPGGTCATCNEELVLNWLDIQNDGFNLPYRTGADIAVEFGYLGASEELVVLDGIYAEAYNFNPGCSYAGLGLVNQITVPEPATGMQMAFGVLFLAGLAATSAAVPRA